MQCSNVIHKQHQNENIGYTYTMLKCHPQIASRWQHTYILTQVHNNQHGLTIQNTQVTLKGALFACLKEFKHQSRTQVTSMSTKFYSKILEAPNNTHKIHDMVEVGWSKIPQTAKCSVTLQVIISMRQVAKHLKSKQISQESEHSTQKNVQSSYEDWQEQIMHGFILLNKLQIGFRNSLHGSFLASIGH